MTVCDQQRWEVPPATNISLSTSMLLVVVEDGIEEF